MITVADMPFVKDLPRDGRLVFVAPYYDYKTAEWSVYIELASEKGKFLRMSTAWPATDIYLAEQPEKPKHMLPEALMEVRFTTNRGRRKKEELPLVSFSAARCLLTGRALTGAQF